MANAIVRVKDGTEAKARLNALESRFGLQRSMQRELDKWRHMDILLAAPEIWRDIPENARKRTIMKPDICSVTNSLVAMLTGRRPKIRTRPKNPLALKQLDQANYNERVGMALFDTLDRIGPKSLISESTEMAIHRGEIIGRVLWLSPEERGEERVTVEPTYLNNITNISDVLGNEPPVPEEVTTKEGRFPLLVQILDPLECSYTLGQDGRLVEFAHRYWTTWADVADSFAGIRDKAEFKNLFTLTSLDSSVEVIDYWTEDEHCIPVNGMAFQEPTPHHYPRIPVIVELVNARPVVVNNTSNITQMMGTPFCLPMLEPIRHMSWADSMKATYLEEAIFTTLNLKHIDPDRSPYMVKNQTTGQVEFRFAVNTGPGQKVIPTFAAEELVYVQPPPIVEVVQEFSQQRGRDAAMTSFPEGTLTGSQTVDLSGYAYAQMKQISTARIEPPRMSLDRFHSRLMMLCNDLIVHWWDLGDVPLVLTALTETKDGPTQQELPLDKGAFLAVAGIDVTIVPEVPINEESEKALIFQAMQSGAMSKMTGIEKLGYVQDASAELKRIAFEKMADNDPTIMKALAMSYMKDNGIEGAAPPQAPPAPMLQAPQPAPLSSPPSSPDSPLSAPAGAAVNPAPVGMGGGLGAPPGAGMGGGVDPQLVQEIAMVRQKYPQDTQQMTDDQIAQMIQQAQQGQQQPQPQAIGA